MECLITYVPLGSAFENNLGFIGTIVTNSYNKLNCATPLKSKFVQINNNNNNTTILRLGSNFH